MPKIETILKAEIIRLAKKEVKAASSSLAGEVRAMKKKLSDLSKKFGLLQRWGKDKMRQDEEKKAQLKAPAEEVKKSRLSPRWILNLRQKLGLSQNKLAILVGASLGTVAMWEKGKFAPRKDKKAALIALRKLGKREVKKVMEKKKGEESGEEKPKRGRPKKAKKPA
ncbi:MAG: hypothetical protein ABIJ56_19470, partial [Pseudomonadota bacterium]